MKKVLVALAMVMGLGSSVAFAYVVSGTQSVEQTQQNPQDEFTKVEVKDRKTGNTENVEIGVLLEYVKNHLGK